MKLLIHAPRALAVLALVTLGSITVGAQAPGAPLTAAIPISAGEVQTVLKTITAAAGDQQLRVVDLGSINLAVGILHRGPAPDTPGAPIIGLAHADITETYYIVSGSGTLVTGGTIANPRSYPADNEVVTTLAGPTTSGAIQNGARRDVTVGDVIIIPAGVPHGWTAIKDHVDYLSVRPDPKKVLPAGYVHPAIKK